MSAPTPTPDPEQSPPPENCGAGGFHTTHWSAVLVAGQAASAEAASALETLCRTYWYPLYAYCRRQGHSPHDCEDFTQQFFAAFLERNSFATATPERGRFRNFLLASFKNFLANDHHRRSAVKRGGRIAFVSLDDTDLETQYRNGPADHATPEHQYDQAWALTLLDKVMKDLKADYAASGKSATFDALQVFLTGGTCDANATYGFIGVGLGMSESAVKMAVLRLRQRYGQMLRREIAQTLDNPEEVGDELLHLAQALAGR